MNTKYTYVCSFDQVTRELGFQTVSNIKKSNIAFKFLNRNESSNAKYGTFH